MINPHKQTSIAGTANDIRDEILRRSFTKRQKDVLGLILRMSYGCGRREAFIPKNRDFTLYGVRENHVKDEIEELIRQAVIFRGDCKGEYLINTDYDRWSVPVVTNWDEDRFKKLIHLNLLEASKERNKLPETGNLGSNVDKQKLPETGSSESDYGIENFPKQEEAIVNADLKNFPKQEGEEEDVFMRKLPETGSLEEENFPKREGELPKTGSSTLDLSSNDAGSQLPNISLYNLKDNLKKDLKDKTIVEIVSYLNAVTGKNFSAGTKETVKLISGRLKEGRTAEDFKHVIDVKTAEWLNHDRMDHYLKPTTLFAQANFESYLNQKRRDGNGQSQGCSQQSGIQPMAQGYRGQGQSTGSKRRFTEDEFDSLGIGQTEVRVPDMQGFSTEQTDSDN